MKHFHQTVQTISNFAIILISILALSIFLANYYFSKNVQDSYVKETGANERIQVDLIDAEWSSNEKHLVLILSTTCRYCYDRIPFYQTLSAKRRADGPRLIAVFPQPLEISRQYLRDHGISVDRLVQGDLDKLGIRGTPTVLAINNRGEIIESWTGRVPDEIENVIFDYFEVN